MKKAFALVCGLIFLLAVTSCTYEKSPKMYVAPAELTKKEENIVNLLGNQKLPPIFDFAADHSLQSIHFKLYELKDGSWEPLSGGGSYAFSDTKGKLAFSFDKLPNGFYSAVQGDEDTSSSSFTSSEIQNFDGMSSTISALSEKQEIVYEQEIPLYIQIITSKNQISSYNVDYFHHPEKYEQLGYEHVYAVTLCFSQKPLS